jgi:hypothetical protein
MQDINKNHRGPKKYYRKEIDWLLVFWCRWNIIKLNRECGIFYTTHDKEEWSSCCEHGFAPSSSV